MRKNQRNRRIAITTSMILSAYLLLAPVSGTAATSPADSAREAKINRSVKIISKEIGIIKNLLNENPPDNRALSFRDLNRMLHMFMKEDTCIIVDRCKLLDFYAEIIKKSTRTELIESAVEEVAGLSVKCGQVQEVLPIVQNALTHKYIGVRLSAANGLFDMGYQKDAYQFYMNIINMNPVELKRIIENQPLDQKWVMMLAPDGLKRDSAYYKERDSNLANWKANIILKIFEQLIKYNDPKTEEALKKAATKNIYIKSVISELIKEKNKFPRAHRASDEVYKKLKTFINEK